MEISWATGSVLVGNQHLTQLLGQLGRIGGNINQLVRRANTGKLSGHDAELANTLDGINKLRDRVREIIR